MLYNNSNNILPLHEFTVRFKARMCELVSDVIEEVAVEGVKLVNGLLRAEEITFDAVQGVYMYVKFPSATWITCKFASELFSWLCVQ